MSPGCVTRVVTADGTRAFVKAVGAELNAGHARCCSGARSRHSSLLGRTTALGRPPGVVRRRRLGRTPPRGRRGSPPRPRRRPGDGRPARRDRPARRATDPGAAARRTRRRHGRTRLRRPPGRVRHDGALSVDRLEALPADLVPESLRRQGDRLSRPWRTCCSNRSPSASSTGTSAVDNLIRRPDGAIVFVDWGTTALGPAWADPLLARLERVESSWFDASLGSSSALRRRRRRPGHRLADRLRLGARLAVDPARGRRRAAHAQRVPADRGPADARRRGSAPGMRDSTRCREPTA